MGLKNRAEWKAWADSDARPLDIPKTPSDAYKDKWLGVGDWLGTNNKHQKDRKFKTPTPDITEHTLRFRQIDPSKYTEFKTRKLNNGILLIFGLE